ncbi:MAG: hypothetical protein ACRD1V_01980 [Vicinamibacterales bacterium]
MLSRSSFICTILTVVFAIPAAAQHDGPDSKYPAIVSGPITAHAAVEIRDEDDKPIALKPEEKIAVMFLEAISDLEDDCSHHLHRVCSMADLVKGVQNPGWNIGHLTHDPATDPNYTYTVTANGTGWEATALPNHPGLGAFFYNCRLISLKRYYNPSGPATAHSIPFANVSIRGERFKKR